MGCLAEMRRCYGVEDKTAPKDGISEPLYPVCSRCGNRALLPIMVAAE